jgi:hypothetical protein
MRILKLLEKKTMHKKFAYLIETEIYLINDFFQVNKLLFLKLFCRFLFN